MPTASYLTNNDYNLVKDIRPFDMPYSSYMSEISTKQQYWKIGADRMKSVYDQAVDLDPQYKQGKEYLRDFMGEATKNLEKISKSDLSIMDNSQQAVTVFKPLFDTNNSFNAALLKDSQLNKHYRKQQQVSDAFRTKDGGKEWNQNNEIYFRDAEQKYLQDAQNGDYSTIDSNFQNRKEFIPYYDYRKEITDIQDACKGYSQEDQDIDRNPGYFNKTSTKGCDPKRLAIAYQTGLSDRARQQIQIDGYSHFRGNEDSLLRKFNDISINQSKEEIDNVKLAIAGLTAGGVTKDEQAKLDEYNAILALKQPQYDKAVSDYEQITKGNPLAYVKNNYDRLAGKVYFDELTNTLGEAFRTDERKKLLLPNAVEMQQRKINADLSVQIMNNNHDISMAGIEHQYKMEEIDKQGTNAYKLAVLKGEITNPDPGNPLTGVTVDTPNIVKVTEADYIESKVKPAEQASNAAYEELKAYMISKYGKDIKPENLTQDGLATFLNEHNGKDPKNQDEDLASLYNNFKKANNNWRTEIDNVRAIDAKIKREHPELYNDSKLEDTKYKDYKLQFSYENNPNDNITVPPPISQKDMNKIINGENISGFTMKWEDPSVVGGKAWKGNLNKEGKTNVLYYNGRIVPPSITANQDIYHLLWKTQQANSVVIADLNKYKTELFTPKFYNNGDYTENNLPYKANSPLDEKIRTLLGGKLGGLNEKNGYKILYRDKTGEGIYVQPLDKDGEVDISSGSEDDLLASLKASYHDAEKVKTPSGWAYKIPKAVPRYSNLPSDFELKEQQINVDRIQNLKTILESDSRMTGAAYVDSFSLPDGFISMDTQTGKTAQISVIHGKSTGYTYVARVPGIEKPIKANSAVELQNLLKLF